MPNLSKKPAPGVYFNILPILSIPTFLLLLFLIGQSLTLTAKGLCFSLYAVIVGISALIRHFLRDTGWYGYSWQFINWFKALGWTNLSNHISINDEKYESLLESFPAIISALLLLTATVLTLVGHLTI